MGNHRHHHAHADTLLDEHSPRLRGFWHAHAGWYLATARWSRPPTWLAAVYGCADSIRTLFDAFWRPRTG